MSYDPDSEPLPTTPAVTPAPPVPPPQPPQQEKGGGTVVLAVIIIVVIIVLAVLFLALGGDDKDDEKKDRDGNGQGEGIKYITALGGRSQAEAAAADWDDSAVLQHVRGFEGRSFDIDREEWSWVSDHNVPTRKDDNIGDGRCMAWEYEYFPQDGDIFDHFHVLVFGNGTVITWEEQVTGSVNSDTLTDWDLDSTQAVELAKTLSLYNNITGKDSVEKYVYYDLWPYYWELNCDDGTDYLRIQVDERAGEIIYHYP